MDIFLIVLIAFKLVCLFFCWKAMSMARKEKNVGDVSSSTNTHDLLAVQGRMNELSKQNQILLEAIEEMKHTKLKHDSNQSS